MRHDARDQQDQVHRGRREQHPQHQVQHPGLAEAARRGHGSIFPGFIRLRGSIAALEELLKTRRAITVSIGGDTRVIPRFRTPLEAELAS